MNWIVFDIQLGKAYEIMNLGYQRLEKKYIFTFQKIARQLRKNVMYIKYTKKI